MHLAFECHGCRHKEQNISFINFYFSSNLLSAHFNLALFHFSQLIITIDYKLKSALLKAF